MVLQSIPEQFQFQPAPAAPVAELGHTSIALHVVAAGYPLDVNLPRHSYTVTCYKQTTTNAGVRTPPVDFAYLSYVAGPTQNALSKSSASVCDSWCSC